MEVDADQNSIFWHLFDEASAIDGGLMAFPDFLEEEGDYPLGCTDAAVPTFSSGSDELLPLPDCLDYKAIPLSCLPQPPPELRGMGNCSPELEWDYVQCLAGPCTPQPELLMEYDHPGECRLLESLPAKRRRSRSGEIGMEEIRAYFDMPITRAATKMNVGLTVLKKRCRDLGISRWPHRKMKSLNTLIQNIQVFNFHARILYVLSLSLSLLL
ncbi:Protein RKD4 [Apostasia shenzhenica]|uniref:Protein RKD4 n=1 Tax=Apostasia shenzhenica TaxID=1088818 RepID=A0A2I0ACS5_9ASPA|nr:Protein RKD4 [Apostasia shenzhenica]